MAATMDDSDNYNMMDGNAYDGGRVSFQRWSRDKMMAARMDDAVLFVSKTGTIYLSQ